MAYDDVKKVAGREPIRIVEIDLVKCALTYGVAPCTASGAAGSECYNTRKTCQDAVNFDGSALLTVKLAEETTAHMHGIDAIPCVTKISTAHTEIAPGERSIGKRGALSLTCRDFPHHDRGIDPYVATRSYTPEDQGTFFGKLRARNPYFQDAEVRIKTGYLQDGYDAANFKTRTYYLEKITGPNKRGMVSFVAQDILRRLDDDRVTCPVITTGTLTAGYLTASTAAFTVTGDADLYDAGNPVVDAAVRLNDEVITYTIGTDNGDGTFTFSGTIARGQDGTTAVDHASGDTAQSCYYFNAQTPREIAYTLYFTFGGIPAGNLDTAQWDVIADRWLQSTFTRRITEPTGIKELLGESHEQMGFFTWWDEDDAKVKLEAVRPPDTGLTTYTEASHIIANTVEVEDKPAKRVTQAHIHYNAATSIDGDKDKHFRNAVKYIDVNAESADQYGDSRIKKIYARWITGTGQASTIGGRYLNRFRDGIRVIKFNIDAKDEDLKTGSQAFLNVSESQSASGANESTLVIIVQRDEIKTGETYACRAWQLYYSGRYAFIVASGTPDYGSATDAQKSAGCWISAAGGDNFSDGGEAYKII